MPVIYTVTKKQKQKTRVDFKHFTHMHAYHTACSHYTHTGDQRCGVLTCKAGSLECEQGTELFISRLIMPMHMVISLAVVSYREGRGLKDVDTSVPLSS